MVNMDSTSDIRLHGPKTPMVGPSWKPLPLPKTETIGKKSRANRRWKTRLRVSSNENRTKGQQNLGKYKLAAEDIERLRVASARLKPQLKSSRLEQQMMTDSAATSQAASEGPSFSASTGAKKGKRRTFSEAGTSTESRNSKVMQGRIDVFEDGVKKRRSARLRGAASMIPPDDVAEEVTHESADVPDGPVDQVGLEDAVLQNGPTRIAEARKSKGDESQELPGPSSRTTNCKASKRRQQLEDHNKETLEDEWSATKESFSVEDFQLYAVRMDRLLSGPMYPLYLSSLARSRSKLVDRGDSWYLVQKLEFGKTDFKFISPRPRPSTRFSSAASERSSTDSSRSSTSFNCSTDSESQDAQTDTGESDQANLTSNRGEEDPNPKPPGIDTENLSFDLPNSVQIWARRRSEVGGLQKIVVVNGTLGNRCRLGHSQNGKYYCLVYASEIPNNVA